MAYESKKIPTDPWNIPQTLNHLFMKEILSYWYFRVPRVCSRGLFPPNKLGRMPSPTYTPNHPRKPNQVPFFHCSFCRGHFGFTGISPDINGRCGVWLAWSNGRISPQTFLFYAGSTRLEKLEITKKLSKQSCMNHFLWFSVSVLLCQSLHKSSTWWHMSSGSNSCLNMKAHLIPLKSGKESSCSSVLFRVVCFPISPQIKDIEYKPWRMPKGVKEY